MDNKKLLQNCRQANLVAVLVRNLFKIINNSKKPSVFVSVSVFISVCNRFTAQKNLTIECRLLYDYLKIYDFLKATNKTSDK